MRSAAALGLLLGLLGYGKAPTTVFRLSGLIRKKPLDYGIAGKGRISGSLAKQALSRLSYGPVVARNPSTPFKLRSR
jgi:hypothetical protein